MYSTMSIVNTFERSLLFLRSFSDYGVMLEIEDFELLPDGRSRVKTVGGRRFKVQNFGFGIFVFERFLRKFTIQCVYF